MRQNRFLVFFALALMFMGSLLIGWRSARGAAVPAKRVADQTAVSPLPILRDYEADRTGLAFNLTTPPLAIRQEQVTVAGLEQTTTAVGAPELPVYATFLALPPDATAVVDVTATGIRITNAPTVNPVPDFRLEPGAGAGPEFAAAATRQLSQPLYELDTAVYEQNALYPETYFSLSDPIYYRDWRLVRLTLHPIRYNPVSHALLQAAELQVNVTFTGADMTQIRPLAGSDPIAETGLGDLILNFQQGQSWRHLPQTVQNAAATALPVGTDTYKIEIDRTGIYEISGADLQAAGMNIQAVNPATIEMIYRGEPVAYQLVHNGDGDLDPGDLIRFYGWTFSGPRLEKQFIGQKNVYWLWANGTPTTIPHVANETGQGHPVVTTFPESITLEGPEKYFYHTRTNKWDIFPNDPDAWYMDRIFKSNATLPFTTTYAITLPHPAPAGPNATYWVEITSDDTIQQNNGRIYINDSTDYGEKNWIWQQNLNISHTVPLTTLQHMVNEVDLVMTTLPTSKNYVNRVTVDYTRLLKAGSDQLIFRAGQPGSHEYHVSDFGVGNAGDVLVWDISEPRLPAQINMAGHISQTGPMTYTYLVGQTHGNGAEFIATTSANLLPPGAITQYVPPDLTPTGNRAEWIAISHSDFMTQAAQLAQHRATAEFTNLSTHVVDIDDITNQYGYGLRLPGAIRSYLQVALGNWNTRYVVLIGDATFNPRHLACVNCGGSFDINEPIYVVADQVFKDTYQGLIPSDHTLVMLTGDDVLPDMAIGRIAVGSAAEAEAAISKIIKYETIQRDPVASAYHRELLFVADDTDAAGDFCEENALIAQEIDPPFNQTHLCLGQTPNLTETLKTKINSSGVSLLNYRGHGSPWNWAGGAILTVDTTDFWLNLNKPTVIISADCLDGYFTYVGRPGMGETFLRMGNPSLNIGTAAHWSSTGLGTTAEHTVLMMGFYEGLLEYGLTAIGDTTVYAKIYFHLQGQPDDEMYSFTLQGDPAMTLFRADVALSKEGQQSAVPGENASFTLNLTNNAFFPARAQIVDTLPHELSFVSANGTVPIDTSVTGNQVTIRLLNPISEGQSAQITLNTQVNGNASGTVTNSATAVAPSYDLNPADNTDTAVLTLLEILSRLFLPITVNQ